MVRSETLLITQPEYLVKFIRINNDRIPLYIFPTIKASSGGIQASKINSAKDAGYTSANFN